MKVNVHMRVLNTVTLEISGENGYPRYRIPGITATKAGMLVVCYECRNGGDWSVIDIGMKKSFDGGKTWSERKIVASGEGKNTVNNPVMFYKRGKLHFVWFENYKRAFHKLSADEGETWSSQKEITCAFDEFRPLNPWTVIAAGPGHGTVLKNGRILLPVWLCSNLTSITAHHPSCAATVYSDDNGKTWHAGEIIPIPEEANANEGTLVELPGGRIMHNVRNELGNKYRYVSLSANGISGWYDGHIDYNLKDPICAAGMCAYSRGILFTNCNSETRTNLTLKKSCDEGKTWKSFMYEKNGGYSDVCYNKITHTVFVVYESNKKIMASEIAL